MDNLIPVICAVFPNGNTFWFKAGDERYTKKVFSAWKEHHQEFKDTKCTMGIVHIWMPEEKFNAIPAVFEDWTLKL